MIWSGLDPEPAGAHGPISSSAQILTEPKPDPTQSVHITDQERFRTKGAWPKAVNQLILSFKYKLVTICSRLNVFLKPAGPQRTIL